MQGKLLVILLAALLAFCLILLAVYLLPALRRQAGRRRLGAFQGETQWRDAMERRAAALLRHTPAFPEADTLFFRVALRRNGIAYERIARRRAAKLLIAAGAGKNPALLENGRAYIDALFLPNGEWAVPMERAEDALLAYAVLTYPGMDMERIRPAMEQTARLLQGLAGETDTVPSCDGTPNLRLARTVGDVCPFLAAYAARYDEPFYLNLAMRQLNEYLLSGMHPVQGLPAQGIDRESGLPIGAFGWSGACAAVAFGMMELSRYLPREDARGVKLAIHSRLLADGVCSLWNSDGSFPRLPSSTLTDSEASAVLCAFLWEVYQKTGDETYVATIRGAQAALKRRTRRNGLVDFSQPESLQPGFYWDVEAPTAGALAAAIYAASKIDARDEAK